MKCHLFFVVCTWIHCGNFNTNEFDILIYMNERKNWTGYEIAQAFGRIVILHEYNDGQRWLKCSKWIYIYNVSALKCRRMRRDVSLRGNLSDSIMPLDLPHIYHWQTNDQKCHMNAFWGIITMVYVCHIAGKPLNICLMCSLFHSPATIYLRLIKKSRVSPSLSLSLSNCHAFQFICYAVEHIEFYMEYFSRAPMNQPSVFYIYIGLLSKGNTQYLITPNECSFYICWFAYIWSPF